MVGFIRPDTALAVPLQGNVAHRAHFDHLFISVQLATEIALFASALEKREFSPHQWVTMKTQSEESNLLANTFLVEEFWFFFTSLLGSDVKPALCSSSLPKSALETQIMKAKRIYNSSWFMVLDLGGRRAT